VTINLSRSSIRILVNGDVKDSCDTAEIFEFEALMKSLLEKLNVVEVSMRIRSST